MVTVRGVPRIFCQGGCTFLADLPPPPPDLDLDPHQDFELDPDPDPWLHCQNDTRQKSIKSQVKKLAFFLVAHCLIFSHDHLSGWGGGDAHGRGGMHRGGGGGCTCILCIPLGYAPGNSTGTVCFIRNSL